MAAVIRLETRISETVKNPEMAFRGFILTVMVTVLAGSQRADWHPLRANGVADLGWKNVPAGEAAGPRFVPAVVGASGGKEIGDWGGSGEAQAGDKTVRLTKIAEIIDREGKPVGPGETVVLESGGNSRGIVSVDAPEKEKRFRLGIVSGMVNNRELAAAGRVRNEKGGWDVFPLAKIEGFTINPQGQFFTKVTDLSDQSYFIDSGDVLIANPEVNLSELNWGGLWSKDLQELFWQSPESFDRAVTETDNILNGRDSRYRTLIEILDKSDQDHPVTSLSPGVVAEGIAEQIMEVELNEELQSLVEKAINNGAARAINTFMANTLDPAEFSEGKLPLWHNSDLHNFVIVPGSGWGGGAAYSPVVLYGSLADREQIRTNPLKAEQNLIHDLGHESVHLLIQQASKHAETSMMMARDGYKNWDDPESGLTHTAMGVFEAAFALGAKTPGVSPNKGVMFLADRIMRGGLSPEETVMVFARVGAHGDFDHRLRQLYDQSKFPDDPELDAVVTGKVPLTDASYLPTTPDVLLETIAQLAGTGTPFKYDPAIEMSYTVIQNSFQTTIIALTPNR